LEIYSPGGMVDGTKIQDKDVNLLSSKRRNPIIADVFSRMDLMERRGSGLRKILDSYTQLDNYSEKLAPEFHSNESEFIVILKN
ncbi:ATP-binding protein, partial [Streptomyces sp. P17]|uniref:ATP-binding protein n=1 Tax=Streptomyces sp. P17 TaxID=3074716 RepID=UPI0028F3E62F